jgi:hypothetical protein
MAVQLTGVSGAVCYAIFFFVGVSAVIYCAWYTIVEVRLHGFNNTFTNQFVVLSIAMGIFAGLATLLDSVFNFRLSLIEAVVEQDPAVLFFVNVFFITSMEIHIFLLCIRTIIILQFSSNQAFSLKIFVGIVQIIGVIYVISVGAKSFGSSSAAIDMWNLISSLLLSAAIAITDISTAVVFARHIRKQQKVLEDGNTKKDHHAATEIIASTGLWIALISLVGGAQFAITGFGPVLNSLTCLIAVLWMRMKLRIERIVDKDAKDAHPAVNDGQTATEKAHATNAKPTVSEVSMA